MSGMDEATTKVVEKIEKLLRLAGNNPNEAEATAAMEKVNALLLAYNLDMATIEQGSNTSGKRVDENTSGGMHRYQRDLWNNIARLNFCMYWTMKVSVKEGTWAAKMKRKVTHEHRVVGRQVNVISTKNMAQYLDGTIERLCRERLGEGSGKLYFSSDAVAFREGIADRVIEKIAERRRDIIRKEEREEAERNRKASEASTPNANATRQLTVSTLTQQERDANNDFLYGEGYSAKMRARQAEWDAEWEERKKEQAAAEAAAEALFEEWAAANPKEYEKQKAKERAQQKAREERASKKRYRFRQTKEDFRRSSGAYHEGYAEGEKVSIDPQVNRGSQKRLG